MQDGAGDRNGVVAAVMPRHTADDLSRTRRLRAAASIIESVGYEMAGRLSASRVARFMLLAAEVERLADDLG